MLVEIRNAQDELMELNTTLQVFADSSSVLAPAQVQIQGGKGTFSVRPGQTARVGSVSVGSQEVAQSAPVYLNPIAGSPAEVVWDFGDKVIGLDREIKGTISLEDAFGNPYRAEGVQLELVWDPDLIVNGKTGGRGTFYVLAGTLPVTVQVAEEFYEGLQLEQVGYGYNATESAFGEMIFPRPRLRIAEVKGYADITLPPEIAFDADPSYRVQVLDLPLQLPVGGRVEFKVQVAGNEGILNLRQKKFLLQKEFAGTVETYEIALQSSTGTLSLPSSASAGVMRLVIDDPDFGSVSQSIEVIGQAAERLELDEATYVNGTVHFLVTGKDAY